MPQRALFDPSGIKDMVLETDPSGNFLTQGNGLGSARDWARLGNLYLNDSVWNGRRLLPAGGESLNGRELSDFMPLFGESVQKGLVPKDGNPTENGSHVVAHEGSIPCR